MAQAALQVLQQGALAAEEMGTAGDVEQHPGGGAAFRHGIGRGPGRVAGAPGGQGLQRPSIDRRLVRHSDESGQERPRLGQRQAGAEPGSLLRRRVHRGEDEAPLLLGDQGQCLPDLVRPPAGG
jgi:hypothetical protein